jgi:hypothetical protein
MVEVVTESQFIRWQVSVKSSFYQIAVDQLYLNPILTRLLGFGQQISVCQFHIHEPVLADHENLTLQDVFKWDKTSFRIKNIYNEFSSRVFVGGIAQKEIYIQSSAGTNPKRALPFEFVNFHDKPFLPLFFSLNFAGMFARIMQTKGAFGKIIFRGGMVVGPLMCSRSRAR